MGTRETLFYISVLFALSLGAALIWKGLGIGWVLLASNWHWPALDARFAFTVVVGIILSYPFRWVLEAIIEAVKKILKK